MSIFGGKIAIAYVVVGLILAVIGGTLIGKFKMEKYLESFENNCGCECSFGDREEVALKTLTQKYRLNYAKEQLFATLKKVFWYIIIGVGIGALIHNWIPTEWIQLILGSNNPFSVILATIVGIPMYGDIFGTIPIAEALLTKGVGLGTILAFMMSVTALSLPSMIMLKKVIKTKLLTVFIGIVSLGIIIIGYLFNSLQFWFA